MMEKSTDTEYAVLAGGCFWCVEAVYERVEGVVSAVSGYTGGSGANPTYEQVCSGTTGHAEAVKITYNPEAISFAQILEIFWKSHDPTTLNRQGADVGTQYRSVVFYYNEEQKEKAIQLKEKLDKSGKYKKPIVTEIIPLKEFYRAEEYHQRYYEKHNKSVNLF